MRRWYKQRHCVLKGRQGMSAVLELGVPITITVIVIVVVLCDHEEFDIHEDRIDN